MSVSAAARLLGGATYPSLGLGSNLSPHDPTTSTTRALRGTQRFAPDGPPLGAHALASRRSDVVPITRRGESAPPINDSSAGRSPLGVEMQRGIVAPGGASHGLLPVAVGSNDPTGGRARPNFLRQGNARRAVPSEALRKPELRPPEHDDHVIRSKRFDRSVNAIYNEPRPDPKAAGVPIRPERAMFKQSVARPLDENSSPTPAAHTSARSAALSLLQSDTTNRVQLPAKARFELPKQRVHAGSGAEMEALREDRAELTAPAKPGYTQLSRAATQAAMPASVGRKLNTPKAAMPQPFRLPVLKDPSSLQQSAGRALSVLEPELPTPAGGPVRQAALQQPTRHASLESLQHVTKLEPGHRQTSLELPRPAVGRGPAETPAAPARAARVAALRAQTASLATLDQGRELVGL